MRIKIIYALPLVVFIVAAVFGGMKRGTYTNITAEEDFMDQCYVAAFPDDLLELTENGAIEEAMHSVSEYVIKAKVIGKREFLFKCSLQKVLVEAVLEGDSNLAGKEIEILLLEADLSSGRPEVAQHFVNTMEVGKAYLIYLEGKVDTLDPSEKVYFIPGTTIAPIFAYEERESIPAGTRTYVSYTKVKDCEYIAQTQEGLDGLYALREYVMNKWEQ